MKYLKIILVLILLSSCSNDDKTDFTTSNDEEIQKYIKDKKLNAIKSSSGLYYVIENQGSGIKPTFTDNVTVAYKGYFTDGTVFDQSNSDGISFGLQRVIAGWTEGVTYFNEGGNGILLIPSRLGYGNSGRGSIPGGAVLIFDIKLISIN
jgi:FKBP-type peptidyl-prolyl cis-trans isomerase FkpA